MTDVEYSMHEVGLLSLIAAMYADQLVSDPDTADAIKAVALKAKSNVTTEPAPNGATYYSTGRYAVTNNRRMRRNWSIEF